MKINNRLNRIGEYGFKNLQKIKNDLLDKGMTIYDFGVGDPDLNININIIEALQDALKYDKFNKYPPYEGILDLKKEIRNYYRNLYDVDLDLDEILITLGAKEALAYIIPALCDDDDNIIITNPGYPVYENASKIWGVNPFKCPIKEHRNYLPNLKNICEEILKSSKAFIVNYPNNPTGACANFDFFNEFRSLCNKYDIIAINDGAYNEITKVPISILQGDKDKKSVEIGSFSKIFNMTGFRLGYVVGNKYVIKSLLKIKANLDSGVFSPIQHSGITALKLGDKYMESIFNIYTTRKTILKSILNKKGIKYFDGEGTFYLWCLTPLNYTTDEFCQELLNNYGIIVTPGYVFGYLGYGYFRISLTLEKELIEKSFSKLKNYN
ncbi:MAG: aminotransferase class I/II-fold pyridoxal phosphate-dependent enzyme [Clostridiaceae bacterium]